MDGRDRNNEAWSESDDDDDIDWGFDLDDCINGGHSSPSNKPWGRQHPLKRARRVPVYQLVRLIEQTHGVDVRLIPSRVKGPVVEMLRHGILGGICLVTASTSMRTYVT
jgi:hypothetical protein